VLPRVYGLSRRAGEDGAQNGGKWSRPQGKARGQLKRGKAGQGKAHPTSAMLLLLAYTISGSESAILLDARG
jgi:hypothetical protein